MLATLALTAALHLAPAQTGTLGLTNVRATYGVLGQERKSDQVLPGDVYVVAFDITGLQVKDDGRVLYAMGMELANREGKALFKQDPRDLEVVNALGGNRLPAFARAAIGTETPPGAYTLTITITDRTARKTEKLVRKFEVLKPQFGFIRLALTYDTAQDAPPLAVPGQTLLLNFGVVGFHVDAKKQANLAVEMRILDEAGNPTLKKPFTGSVHQVLREEFLQHIPWQFPLQLNRTGKFKITIKATDKSTGKTIEQTLDLTVVESK